MELWLFLMATPDIDALKQAGFRLPAATNRVSIVGRNGSGKTVMAAWLLAQANTRSKPWVIVDFKGEEFLSNIPGVEEITLRQTAKKPGVYIVHPVPDEDGIEDFLWRIWQRGKTGVYVDEAHMLHGSSAFQALLTQGRSKGIPMITITQRPSWVSRFVFSEADFYSIFHLNDRRDRNIVAQFIPQDLERPLPEYHSYWHDVKRYKTFHLQPVPDQDKIADQIASRLGSVTQWTAPTSHGPSKIGSRWF